MDLAALRRDVEFFSSARGAAPDPQAQQKKTRAALRALLERHAAELPALPSIDSAADIERFVPEVRYFLALLKASGISV